MKFVYSVIVEVSIKDQIILDREMPADIIDKVVDLIDRMVDIIDRMVDLIEKIVLEIINSKDKIRVLNDGMLYLNNSKHLIGNFINYSFLNR